MKRKYQNKKPTKHHLSILRQIFNLIPNHLVPRLARETGGAHDARTYTPWSHVLALVFAQVTHSIRLNDICDALELHRALSAIRGTYRFVLDQVQSACGACGCPFPLETELECELAAQIPLPSVESSKPSTPCCPSRLNFQAISFGIGRAKAIRHKAGLA